MRKQITKIIACLFFLAAIPFHAFAQYDPAFNPDKIIEDSAFINTNSFKDASGIQKFLESKNSILANTATDFLLKLREPSFVDLKTTVEDPNPNLGRLRTAAELIWDVSRSTGINPQVVLVTLQKEQSLITGHQNDSPERLQKALDNAMGFDCPDSTGCGDILPGFYFQLFGSVDAEGNRYLGAARSLMKSFNTQGGRGPVVGGVPAKVGQQVNLTNSVGAYTNIANQTVTIGNNATAALYRYTPHVFNGNYNFWKYFTTWFKLTDGTLLAIAGDSNVYIIQNGARLIVTPLMARMKGINTASAATYTQADLDNYPAKGYLSPDDNSLFRVDGQYYVFVAGSKRKASDFTLKQRGLNTVNATDISSTDISPYPDGGMLVPSDDTVVKGDNSSDLYVAKNGQLLKYSSLTLKQYKAADKAQTIPQAEIDSYPKGGFVPPTNGTVIKSANSKYSYLVDEGLKRPLVEAIFTNRGIKQSSIITLPGDEFDSVPTTSAATPKEGVVVKAAKSGSVYYFKNGQTHLVSSYVLKQRKMWADITVPDQVVNEWYAGLPLSPKDGTVVKGGKSATVYIVESGKLRVVGADEFKKKKLKSKVQTLPQAEVDAYVKSQVLAANTKK